MSDRTVLDVFANHRSLAYHDRLKSLGIDPDMPFDRFQRWLRWGQRVEKTAHAVAAPALPGSRTWNACLDHIKGEDDAQT